jgi:hypothetical protein
MLTKLFMALCTVEFSVLKIEAELSTPVNTNRAARRQMSKTAFLCVACIHCCRAAVRTAQNFVRLQREICIMKRISVCGNAEEVVK